MASVLIMTWRTVKSKDSVGMNKNMDRTLKGLVELDFLKFLVSYSNAKGKNN